MPAIRRSTVEMYAEMQRSQWPFFVSREDALKKLNINDGGKPRASEKTDIDVPKPKRLKSKTEDSPHDEEGTVWRRI